MSYLIFSESAAPSAPSASKVTIYADSTPNPGLRYLDDSGADKMVTGVNNASTAAQSPTAATRTYITGSNLTIPVVKLKVGATLRWKFAMTKTGAGVATSTIAICFGTAGTTADTDRVSFTKPAGTAVADEGFCEIFATVRSIGAAGVVVGEFTMVHNLAATGHMIIPCACVNTVSAGFDMTGATMIAGLTINTGAADVITISMVQAELYNN